MTETKTIKGNLIKWLCPLIPGLLAFLLLLVCRDSPNYAEYIHARIFFPVIATVLSFFSAQASFSVTELLAICALPALVVLCFLLVHFLRKSTDRRAYAAKLVRGILWLVSCLFLLYMLTHGLNFYRKTVSDLLGYDISPKSAEQLAAVVTELADRASEAREGLTEDEDGVMILREGKLNTLRSSADDLKSGRKAYPLFGWYGCRAKYVCLSELWSYTGISGLYSMLFCEPNINVAQSDFCIPFTVAHEQTHASGFAREDECNFAAFLLCTASENPETRYSGYAMAYIYCANALYKYDLDLWKESRSHLSEAVLRDFAEESAYWDAHQGTVEDFSSSVNDTFLKSQGQESGVLSYNEVVALILAYYESEGLI